MKKSHIPLMAGGLMLLLAGLATYVAAPSPADQTKPAPHHMPDGSLMSHEDGQVGEMHHTEMLVQSEQAFIALMIPHHEEAVAGAQEVLARGGSTPAVRTLAQNIITAQEREIADMKSWYATWYGQPYPGSTNYRPMMRDLSHERGAALDRIFLTDMILHHEGAIMMANSARPYAAHAEVTTLIDNIVRTQTTEISDMNVLLETLE